ncbi:MAG: B12-binding domain-containing radical SAM protein [Pelagibacteraceae bacterium]|nr:B12-binding domain-containing radical SAM protein [Pelagibacteraceae bacterium]
MKAKIALVMCPAWSLETPPLSLGLLAGALKTHNRAAKQFHINLGAAQHVDYDTHQELWAPTGHFFWTNDHSFEDKIIPLYKDYFDKLIDELKEFDVVSFTVYFSNVSVSDYISERLYKANPNIHIFYGGPYCWNAPVGGLRVARPNNEPDRDWIKLSCDTEGELIINDLIDCYESSGNYKDVIGIWTWDDTNRPLHTGIKPPQRQLDKIATPNWDGVDLQAYSEFHYDGHAHLPLQGSRGCSYKCTFCSETRIFRFKSGESIKNEILEQVHKYGITHFSFVDSLVNGSMPQFKILVKELAKEVDKDPKLKQLSLGGYARTHKDMTDSLMKTAAKAGFKWLSIGVESGTPKILEIIEKRQTREITTQLWEACWRHGIRMDANWISGYPKENHIDWIISLAFLYENKHYIPVVAANQFPAGVTPGTPLDQYRDVFNISEKSTIFYDWVSENYKNTYINRFLRVKLCHTFLELWKIYFSGFWTVREDIKRFEVKDPNSIFNQQEYKDWPQRTQGTYWQQLHNKHQFPDQFKINELNYNVPYLEFANIPENDEYDPSVSIEDTIMISTRNEIRVWCWLLYQLVGPYDIEMEFDENYSERNIDEGRLISKFKFTSDLDGNYDLTINNKLTVGKLAKRTIHVCLPNKIKNFDILDYRMRKRKIRQKHSTDKHLDGKLSDNMGVTEDGLIVNYYDISFDDNYTDSGNMNDRYDDENYLVNKYEIPNYIDAFDIEKYKINLKRTFMTGKH